MFRVYRSQIFAVFPLRFYICGSRIVPARPCETRLNLLYCKMDEYPKEDTAVSENNNNSSSELRGVRYSEQLIKNVDGDERPARLIVSEQQRETAQHGEEIASAPEKQGHSPFAAIRNAITGEEEEDFPAYERKASDQSYSRPGAEVPSSAPRKPYEGVTAQDVSYVRRRRSDRLAEDDAVPEREAAGGSTTVWKKEPDPSGTKRFERPAVRPAPDETKAPDGQSTSYSYDSPGSRYIPRGDVPSSSYYGNEGRTDPDEDTYAGEDYKPSLWPKILIITLILLLVAGGALCLLGYMGIGPASKLFAPKTVNTADPNGIITPSEPPVAAITTAAPENDPIREIRQIGGESCDALTAKFSTNIKFSVKTATTIRDICLMYENGEPVAMTEDISPLNPDEQTQWAWHLTVPSFPAPYEGYLTVAYRIGENPDWIASSRAIYVNISDAPAPTAQPVSLPYSEQPEVISFGFKGGQENERELREEVPATEEFIIVTDADVKDVRLCNSERIPVNCSTRSSKSDASSVTWYYTVTFTEPFGDLLYVELKDVNDEWQFSGEFIYAEISEPAGQAAAPDNSGFVISPNKTVEPAATPVQTAEPAPTVFITPAPAPVVTEAPAAAGTAVPEITPAPETAEVPEVDEEPTPMPKLTASFTDDTDPEALKTTQDAYSFSSKGSKNLTDYSRETEISAPAPENYTATNRGVFTFRGDNFRRNAAYGTVNISEGSMEVMWAFPLGSLRVKDNGAYRYGVGWGCQPAIVQWPSDIRPMTNMYPAAKDTKALKEVIFTCQDGKVYFLNLMTGEETRTPIEIGYPMKSSVTVHSKSFPLITFGQADSAMYNGKTGAIGCYVYSLLDSSKLLFLNGREQGGAQKQYLNSNGSFDGSALILYDRNATTINYDDQLLVAGENGLFYTVSLNTEFDVANRTLKIDPEILYLRSKVKSQDEKKTVGMEASIAMYENYVYMADTYGIMKCVDVNTMRIVWSKDCGDNTDATPALDFDENGDLWLYTGNTRAARGSKTAYATIRRLNAMTGEEDWVYTADCVKDNNGFSGCKASPAVGQQSVSHLVFFTVNMTGKGKTSAIVALDKETGKEKWKKELDTTAVSSPVLVYNDMGNAWLIQADESGVLHLMDAATGVELNTLDLGAPIQGSPAVYGNVLVIGTGGTTEKSKQAEGAMYGIRLK